MNGDFELSPDCLFFHKAIYNFSGKTMTQPWNSSEKFNREASEWDNDPRRKALAMAVAQAIIAKTSPLKTMQALEAGCGTGLVSLEIAPLVKRLTAVDTSREMLHVLQKKISVCRIDNIETKHLDLSSPSASLKQGSSFDLIYSSMTLHHISDTARFLNRISTLLAPRGILAIADLDLEDGLFHDDPTEEVHHGFDRAALAALLQAAGLEVASQETIYTIKKKNREENMAEYPVFLCTAIKN
jgi:2-polyprenyl-3-methyl-5-hydroxy-6-metoxy-1,4-benzoquinol methylase